MVIVTHLKADEKFWIKALLQEQKQNTRQISLFNGSKLFKVDPTRPLNQYSFFHKR